MLVHDVARVLDQWFPGRLAESWDNVGLLIGDPTAHVQRVMACLTVTPESAAEAIRERADLIVTHHPVLFRKVQRLCADGPDSAVYALLRAGVAVYSPHTAHDNASGGVNEQLAERLGLLDIRPLRPVATGLEHKVVVFAPESDLERVQAAIFSAGAGVIGNYSECSFRSPGVGTFFGSEQSTPKIGERGRREEVAEFRLEIVVPAARLASVIAAMIEAHPYEEPAYDVYPLEPKSDSIGSSRLGRLAKPISLASLAGTVKKSLTARHIEIVGDANRVCQTAAVACGAAAEFLPDAIRAGCDVFLTGEARFHDLLSAQSAGIGLILAGHYATERFAIETLAGRMASTWPKVEVWASRDESDPGITIP